MDPVSFQVVVGVFVVMIAGMLGYLVTRVNAASSKVDKIIYEYNIPDIWKHFECNDTDHRHLCERVARLEAVNELVRMREETERLKKAVREAEEA